MKVEILSVVTYICPGTSSSELITDGPIRRATYSVSPFLRGFDGPYKKKSGGRRFTLVRLASCYVYFRSYY